MVQTPPTAGPNGADAVFLLGKIFVLRPWRQGLTRHQIPLIRQPGKTAAEARLKLFLPGLHLGDHPAHGPEAGARAEDAIHLPPRATLPGSGADRAAGHHRDGCALQDPTGYETGETPGGREDDLTGQYFSGDFSGVAKA